MNQHEKTAALRELIDAELAAERPGADRHTSEANVVRAKSAYSRSLEAQNSTWDHAFSSDTIVHGTPVGETPPRRRPRPTGALARHTRAAVSWRQALGR